MKSQDRAYDSLAVGIEVAQNKGEVVRTSPRG